MKHMKARIWASGTFSVKLISKLPQIEPRKNMDKTKCQPRAEETDLELWFAKHDFLLAIWEALPEDSVRPVPHFRSWLPSKILTHTKHEFITANILSVKQPTIYKSKINMEQHLDSLK